MSKGSKQRPKKISKEQFDKNWDKIFGKKKKREICGECWLNTGNPKCVCEAKKR